MNNNLSIKTKSVYDLATKADGKRFLVTRRWPRGLSKRRLRITDWVPELAPSNQLLRDWKNNRIGWHEYKLRYFKEMKNKQQFMQKLINLAASCVITLLCFEKEDNPHCHRHLLKNLLEQQKGE